MDVFLVGLVWALVAAVVSGGLVLLRQRFLTGVERPAPDNDVTSAVFAIVGVLYAVIVAFIVIAVWDSVGSARQHTYEEANGLVEVYWVAQHAPEPQRAEIQALCREYAHRVLETEWPRMVDRQPVGREGWVTLDRIRTQVESLTSEDETVRDRYAAAAAALHEVSLGRRARLSASTEGVTTVLWLVLVAGGLLTLIFAYLFDVPGRYAHLIMVVSLTVLVTLLLYAVFQLEYPFSRGTTVGPEAVRFVLFRFDQIGP